MATLKQIQKHEIGMLKDLATICDSNHINYYLAGGTLLGAVRHKGFIPWDDDIDINLTINDIKRLKKCCKKQLPDHYFWQDAWTDRDYKMIWPRLRDTRTKICKIRLTGEKFFEDGLFIDIIPLVRSAKNEKWLRFQIKTIYKWSYCVRNQAAFNRINNKVLIKRIYQIIREVLIYRFGGQLLFWFMQLLQSRQSDKYIVLDVQFYDNYSEDHERKIKQIMVKKDWMRSVEYLFVNEKFKSFSDYDAYLIDHYGENYMVPRKERTHMVPELSQVPGAE